MVYASANDLGLLMQRFVDILLSLNKIAEINIKLLFYLHLEVFPK